MKRFQHGSRHSWPAWPDHSGTEQAWQGSQLPTPRLSGPLCSRHRPRSTSATDFDREPICFCSKFPVFGSGFLGSGHLVWDIRQPSLLEPRQPPIIEFVEVTISLDEPHGWEIIGADITIPQFGSCI